MRCMLIFGTRPEAIKMCPLLLAMKSEQNIETVAVNTGQHADMVAPVLRFFGVSADQTLSLSRQGQGLLELTQRLMDALPHVIERHRPDCILVHGDTTTAFAAALCAFYASIPVVHIEAGLRTGDVHAPFPEEFNRRAIDALSDYLFAPTSSAAAQLLREGHDARRVFTVGNTATDALRLCVRPEFDHPLLRESRGRRLLLLTAHRRESQGENLAALLGAIRSTLEDRDDVFLVFPVHPSPSVRSAALSAFDGCKCARLTEPLELPVLQNLLARATLLLTDSGGLQEEATYLGIPTLVLRRVTERPEGVAAGVLTLAGTEPQVVARQLGRLLDDESLRAAMAHPSAVYGDGHVSEKIVFALRKQIFPLL